MRGKRRLSTLADINVTNLVDVTLVLLIIFILVAPLIQTGINVKTPEVDSPEPLQSDLVIMVKIDKDKNIYLDKEQMVLEDLGENIVNIKKGLPDAPVLIDADGRVPYAFPIEVMAQIQKAGIKDFSLVTKPVERK